MLCQTRLDLAGMQLPHIVDSNICGQCSDQTPWQQVVERGVGWVLPLDNELAFARQIDDFAAWPAPRVMKIKGLAQAYAHEVATRPEVIDANRQLFLTALGRVAS